MVTMCDKMVRCQQRAGNKYRLVVLCALLCVLLQYYCTSLWFAILAFASAINAYELIKQIVLTISTCYLE